MSEIYNQLRPVVAAFDTRISEQNERLDDVFPAEIKKTIKNGTIGNANNSNAVRTIESTACAFGDTVTFYPVRPNAEGFYYLYGYRIYDGNGSTLKDVSTAVANGNVVQITVQDAASIDFFMVEYDGSNYNPLRANTYGYVPYIVVIGGRTLAEHVEKNTADIDEIVDKAEILSNAVWQQGGITDGREQANTKRIRTGFLMVGYSTKLKVLITNGYQYTFTFYDDGKNYIGGSSEWISINNVYDISDFTEGTAYLRVTLKKTSGNIPPADGANISGVLSTPTKKGIEYVLHKTKLLGSKAAHYTDLLSQARFSPSSGDVLTLLHFSDVHDNLNAMEKALEIYETYADKIDDVIHTGDVVRANWSDGLTNWIASGCAESVISVVGNHDSEENLVLGTAGKTTVYGAMLAPYIGNWDVTQPTGVDDSTSGHYCACYYYKDYPDPEIRLIVLDTNWWDDYQKSWLSGVLTDALTNGYAVILACHTPRFVTGITAANFCSYTEPVISESPAFANIPNDWLDPVDDFISDGGEVICMLSGHNHRDHIGYLTNYPDVLCITADKASTARTIDTARIAGEDNETAFNAITFNPVEKLIKIVRFGAEVDGQMRGKHVFCYDYANKQIVAQW